MPIRRNFAAARLTLLLALPYATAGLAVAAESVSLTAREVRHEVQCHLPRSVPCAIRKPPISGYHLLTEKITLDDRGSYWIADLSRRNNEPIRVLSDNGVLHLINVKYLPGPAAATPAKKPRSDSTAATGKPNDQGTAKDGAKLTAKAPTSVEACFERCRSTP